MPVAEKISDPAFISWNKTDNPVHRCLKIIASARFATNVVLLVGVFCTSCQKRHLTPDTEPPAQNTSVEDGLPQDYKHVNGYFYSCFTVDSGGFNAEGNSLISYAAFNDPAANLMTNINHHRDAVSITSETYLDTGNVSVGDVRFNSTVLTPRLFQPAYYSLYQLPLPEFYGKSRWTTDGNGTFTGIDNTVKRGFPELSLPPGSITISGQQAYTVTTAGRFRNCDSVSIFIEHDYLNAKILKTSSRADTVFVFTVNELAPFKGYMYTTITFEGFNYSNSVVNNNIYIFELGRKMRKKLFVQN